MTTINMFDSETKSSAATTESASQQTERSSNQLVARRTLLLFLDSVRLILHREDSFPCLELHLCDRVSHYRKSARGDVAWKGPIRRWVNQVERGD